MTPLSLLATVPFAHRADLEILVAEGGHVAVRIRNEPKNQNHVGTLHAAALVLVGETAGGLAILNEPSLSGFRLVAKGLQIRYRKPASTAVTATARISAEQVAVTLATLDSVGKADLPLSIELLNEEGAAVAELTVDYHLRKQG